MRQIRAAEATPSVHFRIDRIDRPYARAKAGRIIEAVEI
jgi:hypothetical protein